MSNHPLRGNQAAPPSYQALNRDVEAALPRRRAKAQPTSNGAAIFIIFIFAAFFIGTIFPSGIVARSRRYWAGTHWEGLEVFDGCISYGARKYTAELINIPFGDSPARACMETEIVIHGRALIPTSCANAGDDGDRVWGTWIVDNEPSCRTWWDEPNDMGCTPQGSGKRKIEMKLSNYNSNVDDWSEMCRTTPLEYKGLRYDGPMSCENKGGQKIVGGWFIDDEECR